MKSPNSIYQDTEIRGGIPVTSGDIIRIFCDVMRTIKVKRSIIKLELDGIKRYYAIDDEGMILNVNGTAVLVRATSYDLTKIYIFDPKTDTFLGIVNEKIGVYGDEKSMATADRSAIGKHIHKIKEIKKGIANERMAGVEYKGTREDSRPFRKVPSN